MNEVIIFVFCNFMDFSNNKFKIKSVGTKNFFKCVRNLLYGSHVIHHSHVTGEIKGYEHNFCNKMLRNSQNLIPVFVHNLFSFDFFFVLKGISYVFSKQNSWTLVGIIWQISGTQISAVISNWKTQSNITNNRFHILSKMRTKTEK